MKIRLSRKSQNLIFEKNECINSNLCNFINLSAKKNYEYFFIKIDKVIDYL